MTQDPGLAGWLQLTLTPGIGGASLRGLLRRFGLPRDILERDASELVPLIGSGALTAMRSDDVRQSVERALTWLSAPGHGLVTLADETYPRPLLEIPDPPAVLYLKGRAALLQRPSLAIVGSRNATAQGEANAHGFARALSEAGLTIVSGLALGIDAAAHRGALAGDGSTIAVVGTGIDVVYPRSNAALHAEIGERGLLISEFPLGTGAATHHFPRRNRVISGLSRGVLVVEAALASGSLITARSAADQGRDVFAVPGSIHSPLSKGCHALLKSGAKLVESADDILTELSGFHGGAVADTRTPRRPARDGSDDGLLACMGHDPVDVDSLCGRAGLSAEQVSSELLRLELDGRITALPGGLYQRIEKARGT